MWEKSCGFTVGLILSLITWKVDMLICRTSLVRNWKPIRNSQLTLLLCSNADLETSLPHAYLQELAVLIDFLHSAKGCDLGQSMLFTERVCCLQRTWETGCVETLCALHQLLHILIHIMTEKYQWFETVSDTACILSALRGLAMKCPRPSFMSITLIITALLFWRMCGNKIIE